MPGEYDYLYTSQTVGKPPLMARTGSLNVGVDWGSSSFRAYLFNDQLELIDAIESKNGIKKVAATAFEETLFSLIGDKVESGASIVLSGMITSRNGWVETPYIPIPAAPDSFIAQSLKRVVRDMNLYFLPGLSQLTPRADVIRGEELQLFGAIRTYNNARVVMPGTHSKWATLSSGEVTAFQTIVTGELFEVLLTNTLLGQLASENTFHKGIFEQAVLEGYRSETIISELFQCRSGVLLGQLSETEVHSYLSGLLIGNEIREGMHNAGDDSGKIVLVGSDALCNKYLHAFKTLHIDATQAESSIIPAAFSQLLALL